MEYKIVESWDLEKVEREVNDLLKTGWQPQGGIVFGGGIYVQAMIKREKE